MQVTLGKHSGFCPGVLNAIKKINELSSEGICVLGEIIHNERVLEDLKKSGVRFIDSIDEIVGGKVVIRTHGARRETYQILNERGIEIIDCTCPFVANIHKIIEEFYSKGFQIIICGKSNHPEVIESNGWCDNSAIIIGDESFDFSKISSDKVCVIAQTTFSSELFDRILYKIKNLNIKSVEIFKTICYTTKERQEEAEELSKSNDCMIIIGGSHSSNTRELYEICKRNCSKSYLITGLNELENIKFVKRDMRVGIVTGASTPIEQSMEVLAFMEEKKEITTMEEALEQSFRNFKINEKITVVISQADDDGLKVYVNGKTESSIPSEELAVEVYDKNAYVVGDSIDVVVVGKNPLRLSQRKIVEMEKEEELLNSLSIGQDISVKIDGFNKGGLVAKYENFDVFIPGSEISKRFLKTFEGEVGKTLKVRIRKIEHKKSKFGKKVEILASAKDIILEDENLRKEKKEKEARDFIATLNVNDVVTGKVARFREFGAFIQVGPIDCLAHKTDLSYTGKNPEEVLEKGKSYDFVVLSVKPEEMKVSLSYKKLQKSPWEIALETFNVDDVVEGKVTKLLKFGAFVELMDGVDGLVHISEISHDFLDDPSKALKVDDVVKCKIIAIDSDSRKISLSIKALLDKPVKEEKAPAEEVEEKKAKKAKKAPKEKEDDVLSEWIDSPEESGSASIFDLSKTDK